MQSPKTKVVVNLKMSVSSTFAPAFTLVELIIVIVVIAILAAITIVAYNGITSRAQVSADLAGLSQLNQRLATYQVDNAGYPPDLTNSLFVNAGTTTYQYSYNNSVSPQTYCVTATTGTTSYYMNTTTASTPQPGGCWLSAGAITNLVNTPIGPTQTTGSGPTVQPNNYYISTAPADVTEHSIQLTSGLATSGSVAESAWVKSSIAGTINLKARSSDGSTTTYYSIGSSTVSANQWTLISATRSITVPAGTISFGIYISNYISSDVMFVAAPILTQGSTIYNYADGNSNNWAWNGTVNNSTSTGLPV